MLDEIEATAIEAVEIGADELRNRFVDEISPAEYTAYDVKAEADQAAETVMLDVITQSFPDHRIYAEESGEHTGNSEYRWIVDPLDGTNNFTAGLPTFASAATVLHNNEPVVAAVTIPPLNDLYTARVDNGMRYNDQEVMATSDRPLTHGTTFFVIGHDVKRHVSRAEAAKKIQDSMADSCKRVIESWSPCVHWGLLARGLFDGVVTYYLDAEEQYAGELFAAESGVVSRSSGPLYIGALNDERLDELSAAIESPHL
jgi:myo-inositol-1(or 4)-monophosphatase